MTIQSFMDKVKNTYNKYFPKSLCSVQFDRNLYSSIGISCFMAKTISECNHNIWMNDPLSLRLSIDHNGKAFAKDITNESEIPDDLILTVWYNHYRIKPEDKYLCFSSRNVSCRKTSGNADKMITVMDKWFSQLKTQLQNDLDNDMIHKDHEQLIRSKLA